MAVNYNDERFKDVEADKKVALNEVEKTYGGMINESDKYYQAQIDASKQWSKEQQKIQNQKTDFAIKEINQQKDQAKKDYTKEQSGAYVDWQKQSNEYGANAEQMASQGMGGTGFSESSQVSMYNTYQSRVTTARETFNRAILNYDNAIQEARLQNNSILAEIAYNSLQKQLELSLQGFQYKNSLITEMSNKKLEVDNTYYARYQDVLKQINTENAQREEKRQFDLKYALQVKEYNQKVKEHKENIRQFDEEIERLKEKDAKEYALEIKKLEQDKENEENRLAEEKSQFDASQGGSVTFRSGGTSGSSEGDLPLIKNAGLPTTFSVNTPYYQGPRNKDCKNGTFSNGYQPDNVNGKKLEKTGETIQFTTYTLSGQKKLVTQNVWKTPNNKKWYWDGRKNAYLPVPE